MYRIGVDLGGTNIVSGVIDENCNIIGKGKLKTAVPRPAEDIFADIVKTVKLACEDAGISIDEVESIGIGTPGSVNKALGRIEYANNLYFHKVEAVKMIKDAIPGVEVYIENDANCAALGEAIAGAGRGKSSFVAITLGTGVGSGYVLNGNLVTGCNDSGGEFGHMVIDFNGKECSCGRHGCWEAYASATALVRQTKEAMEVHKESAMWELCEGDINKVNGRIAFDAMRMGDDVAAAVCEQYIRYVACGTVNVINALQPAMICFGGGISNEGENLLASLRKYVEEYRYSRYADFQTEICTATLGNDAGIIGAALVKY